MYGTSALEERPPSDPGCHILLTMYYSTHFPCHDRAGPKEWARVPSKIIDCWPRNLSPGEHDGAGHARPQGRPPGLQPVPGTTVRFPGARGPRPRVFTVWPKPTSGLRDARKPLRAPRRTRRKGLQLPSRNPSRAARMVGHAGFEPTTSGSGDQRSIQTELMPHRECYLPFPSTMTISFCVDLCGGASSSCGSRSCVVCASGHTAYTCTSDLVSTYPVGTGCPPR